MFGYVKPHFPLLSEEEFALYRAAYCGLCKTQRKRTGLFSALTLSYDFVFLYLFRAELTETKSIPQERKLRLIHKDDHHFLKENEQLRYCACCAALLNYYKVKDSIHDEPFFKSLLMRLSLPFFRYFLYCARKSCPLPTKEIEEILEGLATLEKEGGHSPDTLAACSAELLAVIASFGIEDELKRFAAERFGRTVGRWLYLVDAVDDYEDDLKKKRFTPFANVPPDKQLIGNALDALCNDADLLLAKIPVYNPSYRAILTNVLYHGMHEEARKILFPEQSQRKDKINERSL